VYFIGPHSPAAAIMIGYLSRLLDREKKIFVRSLGHAKALQKRSVHEKRSLFWFFVGLWLPITMMTYATSMQNVHRRIAAFEKDMVGALP
jgi:hypothetical protein